MARNFKELEAKMSPERRARIATVTRKKIEQIEFSELREEMKFTQAELAEKLKKTQATVSQLESRSDWHLSTLREYIEALGGKIEVSAIFPRRTIRITNLATTAKKATSR
jgi:DNA-binding XRE family transcriptional regulator